MRCYRHGKDTLMARLPCDDTPEYMMVVFSQGRAKRRAVCIPCMRDNKRAYSGRYVLLDLYATDEDVERASSVLEVTHS